MSCTSRVRRKVFASDAFALMSTANSRTDGRRGSSLNAWRSFLIDASALEPRLVATWGQRNEFRFVHDKFGLGTPRALFELPSFSKWKRAVYEAAMELQLSEEDMKRVEELFRIFGEHKSRRAGAIYDGLLTWLDNAEREYTESLSRQC